MNFGVGWMIACGAIRVLLEKNIDMPPLV
ncbi:hypothetical protein LCGC14_2809760, partial [marine sediment metagenome]